MLAGNASARDAICLLAARVAFVRCSSTCRRILDQLPRPMQRLYQVNSETYHFVPILPSKSYQLVPGLDIVTVVSPTGASTHTSYIPFLRQRGEASTGGCLGTSMASNGLNIAEFRGLVY